MGKPTIGGCGFHDWYLANIMWPENTPVKYLQLLLIGCPSLWGHFIMFQHDFWARRPVPVQGCSTGNKVNHFYRFLPVYCCTNCPPYPRLLSSPIHLLALHHWLLLVPSTNFDSFIETLNYLIEWSKTPATIASISRHPHPELALDAKCVSYPPTKMTENTQCDEFRSREVDSRPILSHF